MTLLKKSIASFLALAQIAAIYPALATGTPRKAGSVPGNIGLQLPPGFPGPQAPSRVLLTQLTAVGTNPIETLQRLKASDVPSEIALYQVLSHPQGIAEQREALTAMLGPESFQALATIAHELDKLAEQNSAVRQLLSSGENPALALEEFKRRFDGNSAQPQLGSADPVVVPASVDRGESRPGEFALRKPAASGSSNSSRDRQFLSLAERLARGITRNEGLKLVPWQPLREGDRPTWRLIKEGDDLRVQYVSEDLRGADQEAVMGHFMQEVLRAVYSRQDLIEPDLQSNGLFQTFYDTLETGRVVQKGLKERPGLERNFSAFNQEQYRDPNGEAAADRIKDLPDYLQFLEGALYESRQGQEDPRIRGLRVRGILGKTRPLRKKIAAASPEQAYKLIREIWPTLQKLYEESEQAGMSQKLFEQLGQEGKLGADQEQNAAADQSRLKLDALNKQQREEVQKQIEKLLKGMTPEQREDLRRQIQEQMRQQEQSFRKTMGKAAATTQSQMGRGTAGLRPGGQSQGSSQQGQRTGGITQQLEQAASRLAQEAAQAKSQAQNLEEKASQMRAQTGAREINPQEAQELDAQAGQLRQQADSLSQAAQEFRQMAEQLKRGASSAAAEKTLEQAQQLGDMGKNLQDQSRQLQSQTEALRKQLEQGQGQETSSLRQKAAGIEETSKEIAEKAGKIQEEAREAQALSEALRQQLAGSQGSQGAQKKPGQGAPKQDGQSGQGDLLEQLLKAWAQQKSPGKAGQAGEAADSQGGQDSPGQDSQGQSSGGEINPFGTQGTSDSIGNIEEKIQKLKSGGLDAGQRRWLEEYLEPVRSMIDTLAYKVRKHLKAAVLGRELSGLYEGDVDEDALPYYKAKIGIMKEELLPRRPKARITILLDLSGSMGKIEAGGSLDHAARALLMALKAFRQAFKNERGVEVRVVAYNENPQLPIIGDYMQVKDLSDAVLYKVVERINEIQYNCRGDNCNIRMMDRAVKDIREDIKGHPDTMYALLHIGDGDPGADIASAIRAIYVDPANVKIRFANLAAGPQASDMYEKYKPYSFWALELSELGVKWAEIAEATFKKIWRRPG